MNELKDQDLNIEWRGSISFQISRGDRNLVDNRLTDWMTLQLGPDEGNNHSLEDFPQSVTDLVQKEIKDYLISEKKRMLHNEEYNRERKEELEKLLNEFGSKKEEK